MFFFSCTKQRKARSFTRKRRARTMQRHSQGERKERWRGRDGEGERGGAKRERGAHTHTHAHAHTRTDTHTHRHTQTHTHTHRHTHTHTQTQAGILARVPLLFLKWWLPAQCRPCQRWLQPCHPRHSPAPECTAHVPTRGAAAGLSPAEECGSVACTAQRGVVALPLFPALLGFFPPFAGCLWCGQRFGTQLAVVAVVLLAQRAEVMLTKASRRR